jgi:hypothetical protein
MAASTSAAGGIRRVVAPPPAVAAAAPAAPAEREIVLQLRSAQLAHGSLDAGRVPLMERLLDYVLDSDVEVEDFSAPMSVGMAWELMRSRQGKARGFNMEFYSDKLRLPDCPIPASRPGKYHANARRKRVIANA